MPVLPQSEMTLFDFGYRAPATCPPGPELVGQCVAVYQRHDKKDSAIERWFRDEGVKEAIDETINRAFRAIAAGGLSALPAPSGSKGHHVRRRSASSSSSPLKGWASLTGVVKAASKMTAAQRKRHEAAELRQSFKQKLSAAAYVAGGVDFYQLFKHYDRDNSGELDCGEFISAMRRDAKLSKNSFSDGMLTTIFKVVDVDGSGEIDADEFIAWMEKDELAARAQGPPEMLRPGISLPFRGFFKRCLSSWATYALENVFVAPKDVHGLELSPPGARAVPLRTASKPAKLGKRRGKHTRVSSMASVASFPDDFDFDDVEAAEALAEAEAEEEEGQQDMESLDESEVRQDQFLKTLRRETFAKGTDLSAACRAKSVGGSSTNKDTAAGHDDALTTGSTALSSDEEEEDSDTDDGDDDDGPCLMLILSGDYDVVEYEEASCQTFRQLLATFRDDNGQNRVVAADARGHLVGDYSEFTVCQGQQLVPHVHQRHTRVIAQSQVDVIRIPIRSLRGLYNPLAAAEAAADHAAVVATAAKIDQVCRRGCCRVVHVLVRGW